MYACVCGCLQGYVVPEGSRKVVRDTMNNLLTSPPPYSVAASTRQAVKQLSELLRPCHGLRLLAAWKLSIIHVPVVNLGPPFPAAPCVLVQVSPCARCHNLQLCLAPVLHVRRCGGLCMLPTQLAFMSMCACLCVPPTLQWRWTPPCLSSACAA